MNKKYKTILIAAGTILLLATMAIGAVMVYATHGSSIIDLTTLNADVEHNGAHFVQSGSGAGTGTWNPFLTFNVPGSDPDEKGYNSDGPAQFDEFYGGSRTHPIQLAAIPTVEIGGVTYREFGLDSNDTGRDDYMSIDEFKVFVDDQSDLDSYVELTEVFGNDVAPGKVKVFDMDDNCGIDPDGCTVFMRSQGLSSGSGVSDIIIRVPDTAFGSFPNCYYGSLTCGQYVYLWSAMGYTTDDPLPDGIDQNWNTNAGFEEWQTREAPVVNVSKTADTSYTQDYDWTVDKKVKVDGTCEDSASVDLFTGESQDAEWCIEVTRTLGDQSDQTVFGEITIFNPTGGEVIPNAIDAEITSVADVISSADFTDINAAVDCGVTFPYTLGAGETLVCTYSEATPAADNETTGTNTATVVVADAGTDFEAMAPFDFASTDPGNVTETNASATLTDDEGPLDELFTGSGSTSYVNNYACDADEGETSNTAVITPSDGGTPDDDTATLTLSCSGLSVSKDATTTYTRTYEWDITKSVTPETWDLFSGETGTSRYTVSVDKTGSSDSIFAVSGDITIVNSHPTRAADLTQVRDFIGGIGEVSVDCGGASSVPADGNLVCSYDSVLPDSSSRLNDAVATQQLYDFDEEGSPTADGTMDYNGTADVVFDLENPASEVNAQVNVTDTNGESWGPVSDDTSWNYTRDFTCDDHEGTHDNTATITETGQNDSASVTVNCYDLSVSKDAQTSLTRTFNWTIDKVVDNPGPIELNPGESVDLNYTVTVDLDEPPYVDSEWAVSGDIMISNSHPTRAAELTNVVDEISGIGSVSVDCGGATSVPAGGDLTCSYSSSLPDATSRTNTATATQQLYDFAYDLTPTADGTKDYSGNHAVDFSGATVNEIDESVDVTDSYAGFLGTCDAGDAPCSFYYTRTVTADPFFCGSFTVDNTAEFETNDTGATGQDSVSVTIDVPCLLLGCTPGFWQGGAGSKLWNELNDPQWVYGGANPFIHTTLFNDFFSTVTDSRLDGQTMMQIVSNENGIANVAEKAARDMVAAYLNEASFPGDFPAVSLAALEAEWYAAVAGGDSGLAAFHTKWAGINEPPEGGYCPLP